MAIQHKKKTLSLSARQKIYFLLLSLLVLLGVAAYNYRIDIERHIIHPKPQTAKTVQLGKTTFSLQQLHSPQITSYDVDKILSFQIRGDQFYISLRSQDGETTQVQAYDLQEGSLYPHTSFGKKGIFTINDKMVLSVNVGTKGDIYYVKKGIHVLRDGNDIISLKGSTTATRVELLPGEQKAYLYGNDNFTLATIRDGAFENNKPAFLHNRAKPFAGGLTLIQIASDGSIYGGGRIKPNDLNIVVGFSPKGKPIRYFGSYHQTDQDSIYNLIDMAVLDNYLAVIDGFTLKLWSRDGHYLGSFNNSKLLGSNLNCAKLYPLNDKTLAILAYVRNSETKLVEIKLFTLTFPR